MKQIKQNKKSIILATAFLLAILAISVSVIYWLKKDNGLTPEPKNEVVSEFTPEERQMRDEIISQIIAENNKNTSYFRLYKEAFVKDYEYSLYVLKYDEKVAKASANNGIVLNIVH